VPYLLRIPQILSLFLSDYFGIRDFLGEGENVGINSDLTPCLKVEYELWDNDECFFICKAGQDLP